MECRGLSVPSDRTGGYLQGSGDSGSDCCHHGGGGEGIQVRNIFSGIGNKICGLVMD